IVPLDAGILIPDLQRHYDRYNTLQRELQLLNSYASRTSALRKELMKTEMRIRQKNAFFSRLSQIGDTIFPRRKELIQEVSKLFIDDVEQFIQRTFAGELHTSELIRVSEEIKLLQSFAKVRTLTDEACPQTRSRMSE